MTHDQAWHDRRRQGLGGSDSPVVLGYPPYPYKSRLDLWAEKRGLVEPGESGPDANRGSFMEPHVADMYEEATGIQLTIPEESFTHSDYPWMLANVDRLQTSVLRGRGIVEIKCPGLHVFGKCQREGLPPYYQIQGQHCLAASARAWGTFLVFNSERWRLETIDFERDETLIEQIIAADADFWKLVQSGTPPEDDAPKVDLPDAGGQQIMALDTAGSLAVTSEYAEAKHLHEQTAEHLAACKSRVIETMGPFNVAEGGGWRFYHTARPGRKMLDKPRLAAALPEGKALTDFEKQGKSFQEFRAYCLGRDASRE